MITCRSDEAAGRLKQLALHGMSKDAWKRFSDEGYKHYYVTECGYKYNMTDLQASLGIHQLKRIEAYWHRRNVLWGKYMKAFADLPVGLPAPPQDGTRHALHLFTLFIDKARCEISRDEFLEAMTTHGIGTGVHYLSIPEHPFYRESFGWRPEQYPHAMRAGRQTVSIPLSPKLGETDVERVIEAVRAILRSVP